MKTLAKNPDPGILSNPINRNLLLIAVSALAIAVAVVTGSVILYYQL